MGIKGFKSYLEGKRIVTHSGIPSYRLTSGGKMLDVVMDGNSFESTVFSKVLDIGGAASPFSFQKVYDYAKYVLDVIKSCNVVVKRVYVDGVEDWDKLKRKKDRHNEKEDGNRMLLTHLTQNPHERCHGDLSTSLVCRYAVKTAIHDVFPEVEFCSGGLDCDRDIAKYAHSSGCFVITSDTDFFVFDVPGVIYLRWMMKDIRSIKRKRSIVVYPHKGLLNSHGLNESSIRYLAFQCGNDFTKELNSNVEEVAWNCWDIHDSIDAVLKDALARFPQKINLRETLKLVWEKYDIESYPAFPLSYLPLTKEKSGDADDAGEVVGEGNDLQLAPFIQSFSILQSTSSLNYFFSPVLTMPVPYEEDPPFLERAERLKVMLYDFLGNGAKDPYVVVSCKGIVHAKDRITIDFEKDFAPIARSRISFCLHLRRLPEEQRFEQLKKGMAPVFDSLEYEGNSHLFADAILLIVRYLYPTGFDNAIQHLSDMLSGKNAHVDFEEYRSVFLAFNALQYGLDLVAAMFDILQLFVDMDVIKRIDLLNLIN